MRHLFWACELYQWAERLGDPGYFPGCGGFRTIAASKSGSDVSPAIRSNPFMRNLSVLTGSMYIVADPESPSGKTAVDLMIQMPFTSAQRPSP